MYKAEIKAGANIYTLEFPDVTTLREAYEMAYEVAKGETVHEAPTQILDLNYERYDHIRVWEEDVLASLPFGHVQPPIITEAPKENPRLVNEPMEYLGQKITLTAAVYEYDGSVYALPYQINGLPALSSLGNKGLEELTVTYGYREYGGNDDTFVPVLPHGALANDQEALDYVKDYAEEAEEVRETMIQDTDKAAKGFSWPSEK